LVENSTLFVSELDSRVTNEMLKDAFQQFGAVKRAEVFFFFFISAQRWDEKRTGTNVQILTCFT
jgi:RNA recognition motif-containing protein